MLACACGLFFQLIGACAPQLWEPTSRRWLSQKCGESKGDRCPGGRRFSNFFWSSLLTASVGLRILFGVKGIDSSYASSGQATITDGMKQDASEFTGAHVEDITVRAASC